MNLKATTTILFLVAILSEAWEVTSSFRTRSLDKEGGTRALKDNEAKYQFGTRLGHDEVGSSRNLLQALPPFPPRTAQRRTKGDDKKGNEDHTKNDNVDEKNTDRSGQSSSSSSISVPESSKSCVPLTVWL